MPILEAGIFVKVFGGDALKDIDGFVLATGAGFDSILSGDEVFSASDEFFSNVFAEAVFEETGAFVDFVIILLGDTAPFVICCPEVSFATGFDVEEDVFDVFILLEIGAGFGFTKGFVPVGFVPIIVLFPGLVGFGFAPALSTSLATSFSEDFGKVLTGDVEGVFSARLIGDGLALIFVGDNFFGAISGFLIAVFVLTPFAIPVLIPPAIPLELDTAAVDFAGAFSLMPIPSDIFLIGSCFTLLLVWTVPATATFSSLFFPRSAFLSVFFNS